MGHTIARSVGIACANRTRIWGFRPPDPPPQRVWFVRCGFAETDRFVGLWDGKIRNKTKTSNITDPHLNRGTPKE
jgi:hypothetical protein